MANVLKIEKQRFRVLDQGSRAKFRIGWNIVRAVGPALAGLVFGEGIPFLGKDGQPVIDPETGRPFMVKLQDVLVSAAAREQLGQRAIEAFHKLDDRQALEFVERVLLGNVEVDVTGGNADESAPAGQGGWVTVKSGEQIDALIPDPLNLVRLVLEVAGELAGPTSAAADTPDDS